MKRLKMTCTKAAQTGLLILTAFATTLGCGGNSGSSSGGTTNSGGSSGNGTFNSEWPDEPGPDFCEIGSCEKRNAALRKVISYHPGNWMYVNSSLSDLDDFWSTLEFQFDPDSEETLTGKFSFGESVSLAPDELLFTSGDFAFRNGHLALRSADRKHATYLKYTVLDIRGRNVTYFYGAFPVKGDRDTETKTIPINLYR